MWGEGAAPCLGRAAGGRGGEGWNEMYATQDSAPCVDWYKDQSQLSPLRMQIVKANVRWHAPWSQQYKLYPPKKQFSEREKRQ